MNPNDVADTSRCDRQEPVPCGASHEDHELIEEEYTGPLSGQKLLRYERRCPDGKGVWEAAEDPRTVC